MELIKLGEDSPYSPYFFGNEDSLIYLNCQVSNNCPGGPFFDKEKGQYSVPINVNKALLNEDKLNSNYSSRRGDVKDMVLTYGERIDLVSELLLGRDIGFKRGQSFELFLNNLRDTREMRPSNNFISICGADINQLVRRYNF